MKAQVKKIACTLGLFAIAMATHAQFSLKAGVQAGAVTGPVRIENIDNRFTEMIDGKSISGFEAGLLLKAQLGPVYVKPMVLYGFRTGNVTYTTTTDYNEQSTTFNINKLEVPVMVGLKFLGPVFVEAGPSYNYIFDVTDRYQDYTVQVTNSTIGYRVGAGAELGPVILSLSYGGATFNYSGDRATFREPHKFILGVGLVFGGGGGDNDNDND